MEDLNLLNDFIKRTNPKNINKLQLEGLVKAGAFDDLEKNRKSLFQSIPELILLNKSIFEEKNSKQNNLFSNEPDENNYNFEIKKS